MVKPAGDLPPLPPAPEPPVPEPPAEPVPSWEVCQVGYSRLSGPCSWFNLRCSFSTSLRLTITLHFWRISLKLWRRNRVLTPSRSPFHLYVMPFRSQERFMILGRYPPTWKAWCERPGLSPMRRQTTMPQF